MAADDFLDSRGMGEAQGKKVDPSAIAVQAIEAQPAFGQIKPMRGQVLACTEQHCRRRASYLSARTRGSEPKEKEEKPQRTECATVIEADRTNGDESQNSGLSSANEVAAVRSKRPIATLRPS